MSDRGWARLLLGLMIGVLVSACNPGVIDTGPNDGDVSDGNPDSGPRDSDVDPCQGVSCGDGQHCVEGRCVSINLCDDVTCPNPGEVCDPRDGTCRSGGADEDHDDYTIAEGDCDDGNAGINPGAVELCDGVDQNCDRQVDEGFPDEDGDGYDTCGQGDPSRADCDDSDPLRFPGRAEECDGRDNDCDGAIDEDVGTRPCSTACGSGTATCVGGDWRCDAPEVCECTPPGSEQRDECGNCGWTSRTCQGDYTWSNWSDCRDEGECRANSTGPCTTSCGSTGRRTCSDSCTWGSCTAPEEICNGQDDDCDGVCDEGSCRVGVHRSWCAATEDHFYTTNSAEASCGDCNGSGSCCGCTVESTNYFYLSETQVPGTAPIYRCWRPHATEHFYTYSSTCEGSPDAVNQGILGYAFTSQVCGTVPLFRLYNPDNGDHFFTIMPAERDNAVAGGWILEGETYVWPYW